VILVTGGSGFIGSHLVTALVAAGKSVRAVARSAEAATRIEAAATTGGGTVEVVTGDIGDDESLKAAAEGCELIFHLAGTYRGSAADLQSSHVAGTAKLLRAADKDSRFVYVSSTSVYGWDRQWPADHATTPAPRSAYGRAKLGAEQLVLARTTGSSVVLRPTITYGPGDTTGMLARIVKLLNRGVRRFPGTGENRIHLTHVDDLVAGLMLAGESGDGIFVLAGPEAASVRRIIDLVARGAGAEPPTFGIPASPLRVLSRGLEMAWSAAGIEGEPPLSSHSVDVATQDRAYSAERAQAELGWKPAIGLDEGLPATGAWLAANLPRRTLPGFEPDSDASGAAAVGFDWRGYFEDPDEGLGTVYERFALAKVLESSMEQTGSHSVLHAPLFGMMGIPGLDAVFLARKGVRVGLLDFNAERLEAVRTQWEELGLTPEIHLVPGPDPSTWPEKLDADYDLVFSFAALWWFEKPWEVLAAQSRWAGRGVLSCVPNKNVFMKMRAKLWHKDLFERLNEEALDASVMTAAARRTGLKPIDTGLFDIPPFPDTSVPLAKVVRAALGKGGSKANPETGSNDAGGESGEGAWKWSILPYLQGEQPDIEERVERLTVLERHIPAAIAPSLAHHRYVLYSPDFTGTPPARSPDSVRMRRKSGTGA